MDRNISHSQISFFSDQFHFSCNLSLSTSIAPTHVTGVGRAFVRIPIRPFPFGTVRCISVSLSQSGRRRDTTESEEAPFALDGTILRS